MVHVTLGALVVLLASSSAPDARCADAHLARERTRITAHLTAVERELRASDMSLLDDERRAKRLRLLDVLHAYTARGVFPQNDVSSTMTPIFVDSGGRTCAVAELLTQDGRVDIVREVVARENLARVPVMQTESLLAWAETSGFTVAELAQIQPQYDACSSGTDTDLIVVPCSGPTDACWGTPCNPVCDDLGQNFRDECIAKTCITPGATEEKCYDGQGCSTLHGAPSTTIAWGMLALALRTRRRPRSRMNPRGRGDGVE